MSIKKIRRSKKVRNTRFVSFDEFVKRAIKRHGDKYDYSKTVLKNQRDRITIICPEHGEFTQLAQNHHKCITACYHCRKNVPRKMSAIVDNF